MSLLQIQAQAELELRRRGVPRNTIKQSVKSPRTDDELYQAIVDTLGIQIPRLKVCADHVAPFTALADAYFARHSVSIWTASRGFGGKSYLLATLAFMEAVTLGASVTVLGGSGEQSERVNQYINQFWNAPHAPRHLLADDPSKRRVRLKNGNMIEALMASQASVRGAHPSRLRMDEIDVMALPILDAAFGQPMSQPGIPMQTVLSSTHHNPRGTMTTILERAREKKWPVQSWCVDANSVIISPIKNKRIYEIEKGDIVYAYRNGRIIHTRVVNVWPSGRKQTIKLHFGNRSFECTEEHKIYTEGGWKRAGLFQTGDFVYCLREGFSENWENGIMQGLSEKRNIKETKTLFKLWEGFATASTRKIRFMSQVFMGKNTIGNSGFSLRKMQSYTLWKKQNGLMLRLLCGIKTISQSAFLYRMRGTTVKRGKHKMQGMPKKDFGLQDSASILFKVRKRITKSWESLSGKNRNMCQVPHRNWMGEKKESWCFPWPMSSMWRSQNKSIQGMCLVLPQKHDEKKYRSSWLYGFCKRTIGSYNQKETKSKRIKGKGIIRRIGSRICRGITDWSIFCRFCCAKTDDSHRSKWNLLAFITSSDREGSKKSTLFERGGISISSIVGKSTPALVAEVITSIEKGDNREVWDLTVEDGESFFANDVLVHNCFMETMQPHGWLDPADVEQKRKDVTESMWAIEYDLKTPKPEDVAINTDKVEKMFDKRLGNFVGGVGEHIVIEQAQKGATYVTGIDWGKKQHWSVIWTFRTDKAPIKLVSFLRIARTAWPVMQQAADNIIKMFPGTSFHDEGGVGDAVGDNLTVDVQGQILVGKLRSLVFGAYIIGIESGKVIAPMIDWAYNEHKYCTRDDLYGSGHPPDSFIAGALAWHAYNNQGWTW